MARMIGDAPKSWIGCVGLARSRGTQVDSAGPVGETLRAVGGVSSAVVTKGILPAAKAVNNFVPCRAPCI